ncbi:poly-beta-1,6-N-acetyl-D-glucosamine biosynthesis protein PgaD [Lachnospiraceae bacterium]|nr:poly-beta-1,6-N-acetyl-D-glucosamine biosynthesis protein PgaD [Lachnospiraceae bacterium]
MRKNNMKQQNNDSLPQEVEYDIKEHLILGKQKKWKQVIEWILTILGWFIMLSYIGYIIYGNIAIRHNLFLPELGVFNRYMIEEVDKYYLFLLVILLLIFLIFIIWKNYNKKRFGSLHRRQFKPDVTVKELAERFETTEEKILEMQNERVITLEHNIIPEELGIGKSSSKRKDADR